jgi:ABC-type nitrate/sulfonate/bicarbonate transport system substrate-binding protein
VPPPPPSAARRTCRSAASPSTTGARRPCSIRAPRIASTRRATWWASESGWCPAASRSTSTAPCSPPTASTVDWDAKALLEGKVDALIDYEEIAPGELIAQGRKITVLRFADFGVRIYSLNLIVNEMAWMEPDRQSIARKIAEAVQEGYQLVRDRPADAAEIFGKRFPDLAPRYVEVSMQIVARQLGVPIGSQTRLGWEDTLKVLSSLGLLARAVSAEEVAIYD